MKISKKLFDELQALGHAYIDQETGKEMLNPIPKELEPGLERKKTISERIQEAIERELSRQASIREFETMQEANTFDLEDEVAVRLSGYELTTEEFPPMDPDSFTRPTKELEPEPDPDPEPEPKDPISENTNPENQGP